MGPADALEFSHQQPGFGRNRDAGQLAQNLGGFAHAFGVDDELFGMNQGAGELGGFRGAEKMRMEFTQLFHDAGF